MRYMDYPEGEMADEYVPQSQLKLIPDSLERLKRYHVFHYEIKNVPKKLLDAALIGLDFKVTLRDPFTAVQKNNNYNLLFIGKLSITCSIFLYRYL